MARTVKDLAEYFSQLVKEGKGDYVVFLTDDEEGNGYHACWYNGKTPAEMDEIERPLFEDCNCDISILKDKNKAVYLG